MFDEWVLSITYSGIQRKGWGPPSVSVNDPLIPEF